MQTPSYLLSLASDLEARIQTGDLRGYTTEQLERAANHYRWLAAKGGAL